MANGVAAGGRRTARAGGRPESKTPPQAADGPADNPDQTAVLKQIRELFRVSQRHFQRVESRSGVSGAQLWALAELQRRPGLTISQVAQALSIHLSTSSNLLDKLENQGFVRRERRSKDQRVVKVYLTATGKRMLAKAPESPEGVIPDALSKMSGAALRRLHQDLAVLLDHASGRNGSGAARQLS